MSDYIFAAKLADLTEDAIIPLDYDDAPIAIAKKGNRIFAFGDICTHDDGPLADGVIEPCNGSLCVVCPRHGATFDLYRQRNLPRRRAHPHLQNKNHG